MSRCFLGTKKIKIIEAILKKKVVSASVRGGNEHFWASVSVEGSDQSLLVNYKTRKVVSDTNQAHVDVQAAFDSAWQSGASELEARAHANAVSQTIWGV